MQRCRLGKHPVLIAAWFAGWILGWGTSQGLVAGESGEGVIRSDWGPFYSDVEDPGGHRRRRALGPMLEQTDAAQGHSFWAVRPLVSRIAEPAKRRSRVEVLWPLAIGRRLDDQSSLRLLTGWFVDWDVQDPASPYRVWFLPFYFQGRSQQGENYLALFPVGGTVKELIGRDDTRFVLFPLYTQTTYEDLETTHLLWPFFKRGRSDEIDRLRVFPFYQHNRIEDRYRKSSVLWPVWNTVEYTHQKDGGGGFILFPIAGRLRLPQEETWMLLPPLFRWTASDTLHRWYVPYPFLQFSIGEIEKTTIMPFYGSKIMGGSHRTFYLWPIVWRMEVDQGDSIIRRRVVLPVFFLTTQQARGDGEQPGAVLRRNLHVWPVFSHRRQGDESVTRALDLWPPSWRGPFERNYAAFLSLYVRTRVGDRSLEEALWGWYRRYSLGDEENYVSLFPFVEYHRSGSESMERSFSLFKGLLGYRRTPHGRSLRLLYLFHFGNAQGPS